MSEPQSHQHSRSKEDNLHVHRQEDKVHNYINASNSHLVYTSTTNHNVPIQQVNVVQQSSKSTLQSGVRYQSSKYQHLVGSIPSSNVVSQRSTNQFGQMVAGQMVTPSASSQNIQIIKQQPSTINVTKHETVYKAGLDDSNEHKTVVHKQLVQKPVVYQNVVSSPIVHQQQVVTEPVVQQQVIKKQVVQQQPIVVSEPVVTKQVVQQEVVQQQPIVVSQQRVTSPQRVSVLRSTSPQRVSVVRATSPQRVSVVRAASPQRVSVVQQSTRVLKAQQPVTVQKIQYSQQFQHPVEVQQIVQQPVEVQNIVQQPVEIVQQPLQVSQPVQFQQPLQVSQQLQATHPDQQELVRELEEKIRILESERVERSLLIEVESRNEQLLMENKELHVNMERLIEENSRLLIIVDENKTQLVRKDSLEEQLILLGIELERMHLVLNEKMNEIVQLEDSYAVLNGQTQELNDAYNQNIEQHRLQMEKNEQLEINIQQLQVELKEITDRLQNAMEYEQKYREGEEKIEILIQEIERMKLMQQNQLQEIDGLNQQIDQQMKELQKQEEDMKEYESRIGMLTQEVARLNGLIEEKVAYYELELQNMEKHFQVIIQEYQTKEETLVQQINEYKITIDSHTTTVETNREEAEKLHNKLKKQIEINEMQLDELKQANVEIEKLKQEIVKLKESNVQTTQTIKVQQVPTTTVTQNVAGQRVSMMPTYQRSSQIIDPQKIPITNYSTVKELSPSKVNLQQKRSSEVVYLKQNSPTLITQQQQIGGGARMSLAQQQSSPGLATSGIRMSLAQQQSSPGLATSGHRMSVNQIISQNQNQ